MRIHRNIFLGFFGSCLLLSIVPPSPIQQNMSTQRMCSGQDTAVQSHEEEIRAWHERRIASLKREHSWLSLVALDWLQEGQNPIASIGVLRIEGGTATLQVFTGVTATVGGNAFTSGVIRTDAEKDGPDKVIVGSRAFVIIKRGDRYALRMWDSNAEARRKFTGIERFPVSTAWHVSARWVPYNPPRQIKVPSVIPEYLQNYAVPGVAVFTVDGTECYLEPVLEDSASDLFFIFGDKTNGRETYGGGRFLYSQPPKDGAVVLDFNKAYNPPCAFSPYATCPLPPASNRLPVRIEAGEKRYREH